MKNPYRKSSLRPLDEKELERDRTKRAKRRAKLSGFGLVAFILSDLFAWAQIHDHRLIANAGATWMLIAVLNIILLFICAITAWAALDKGFGK